MAFTSLNYVFICKWMTLMIFCTGQSTDNVTEPPNEKIEIMTTNHPLSLPPYPELENYYSLDSVPSRPCEIVCSRSGLTTIKVEMLVLSFNEALNLFAKKNFLSNVYRLQWNNKLAEVAKAKSVKCLPPTHNGVKRKYLLDDDTSYLKYANNIDTLGLLEYVPLDVVIGRRTLNQSAYLIENFYELMVKDYTKYFFTSEDAFKRILGSITMGCGYIVEEESNQYYADQLLCMFGPVYEYPDNEFKPGIPCSECNLYSTFNVHSWHCDLAFPFLCTDLDYNENIDDLYSLYKCNDTSSTFEPPESEPGKINLEDENNLPCLSIFIPLAIIAIIFFALCIYNIGRALIFKKNNEK